ncbi:MAG: hypothetical protein ACFE0R_01345 [Salinarimonas sp.]
MGKGWLLVWSAVLAVCVAVFLARAVFAVAETPWAWITVLGLFALLYAVFLLEGLQTAASQLLAADEESLGRFIDGSRALNDAQKKRIRKVVDKLRENEPAFKSGREFLAIASIVSIALLFQSLPFDPTGAAVAEALGALSGRVSPMLEPTVASAVRRALDGSVVVLVLGHIATAISVSALLPFWVSQLLPQVLADRRGIRFTLLWLAPLLARESIRIGRLRIGEPSVKLSGVVKRALELEDEEHILVGSAQLLERLESYFGLIVTKRTIRIDASGCTVTDTWTMRFSARRRDVRQLIRIDGIHVRLRQWDAQLPTGVQAGRLIKTMLVSYEELRRARPVQARTNGDDAAGDEVPADPGQTDANGDALERRLVGEELVFLLEAPLQVSLPREGRISEEVTLALSYDMLPLDHELDDAQTLSFDIAKPTERVEIALAADEGQFIREPEVRFVPSDEMNMLTRPDEVLSVDPQIAQRGNGWTIDVKHPPFGSRMILSLDLRNNG